VVARLFQLPGAPQVLGPAYGFASFLGVVDAADAAVAAILDRLAEMLG
jgi:hypothetical protein